MCLRGGPSLVLGDGTLYCEEEPSITEVTSFEEDGQRFKVTKSDGGSRQFRWSEERQYIVVGMYQQDPGSSGFYRCMVHLDGASLQGNWTVDDITDPYAYNLVPGWCNQAFDSEEQAGNWSPVDVSPFENTTLWLVESDDMGYFCGVRFGLNSVEETCYVLPYDEGLIVLLFPLFFAGVGLYMLSFADDRRHQLTFHTPSQSLRWRKSFGGSPVTGSTWKQVDFASLAVVNTRSYSDGWNEVSFSHDGRQLQITVEGEALPLLFISINRQDDAALAAVVAQLESSLGVTVQRLDNAIQLDEAAPVVRDNRDEEPLPSDDYISREALLASIHGAKDDIGSPSTESSSDSALNLHPESSSANDQGPGGESTDSDASFWGGLDGDEG